MVRLQKYLSAAGVCSRRAGEGLIQAGRVQVNGVTVIEMGTRVDPDLDMVQVDGRTVNPDTTLIYILVNKPRGYVTSCRRHRDPIVLDLVAPSERIYPVGRLDKDSTGLLLLTNDGRLHHQLSHPAFNHEKEYDVAVQHPISQRDLKRLSHGVELKGKRTRPALVRPMGSKRFRIVLREGRNRQIRRMVNKIGNEVTRLKRIRIAHLTLGSLPEGQWRYCTQKETRKLQALVGGKH